MNRTAGRGVRHPRRGPWRSRHEAAQGGRASKMPAPSVTPTRRRRSSSPHLDSARRRRGKRPDAQTRLARDNVPPPSPTHPTITPYKESFARGCLLHPADSPDKPTDTPELRARPASPTSSAAAVALHDRPDALHATFTMLRHPGRRHRAELVHAGVLGGVSVEFQPIEAEPSTASSNAPRSGSATSPYAGRPAHAGRRRCSPSATPAKPWADTAAAHTTPNGGSGYADTSSARPLHMPLVRCSSDAGRPRHAARARRPAVRSGQHRLELRALQLQARPRDTTTSPF